jgi:serine/threonine-protein kinase
MMADHPFSAQDLQGALQHRYVIGPEIAVGGQGVVYKATRTRRADGTQTNDLVALKLHLYRHQDARIQREITAMETISHPNLARLVEHGHFYEAGRHTRYVAWEFIDGQTLSHRLRAGRLTESEALAMGCDISAAIGEIWSRRIVHGDIKPLNIMMKASGGAVLIDLSAARHLEEDNTASAREPFGTSGYFSPEQLRGVKALSCASDIFSLGVVMLQCLLGSHPTEYHQSALTGGIRASGFRVGVSPGLQSTLDKMLSTDPRFRPSPAGLHDNLHRLREKMKADYKSGERPRPSLGQ